MDCVNAAIEKVKEQYPTAMLYEAEGRSTIGPPSSRPQRFSLVLKTAQRSLSNLIITTSLRNRF